MDTERDDNSDSQSISFSRSMKRIPTLVNKQHVTEMIKLQEATLIKFEHTNKSVADCNTMAQSRIAATNKLYKRTAKQILESKRDLDVIYKKIHDMKAKIRLERPDLFEAKQSGTCAKSHSDSEGLDKPEETTEASP